MDRRTWRAGTALGAATGFLVLSVLVATHVTERLDARAVQLFRPDNEWGRTQVLLVPVIDFLEPRRVIVVLAVAAVGACLRRGAWRPAWYASLVALATGVVTMATKFLVHRPDPRSDMTALGGSYPSGHMVALLVCLGGALLVLGVRTRWWHWLLLGLVASWMGAALLFTAAHSLTDVVGGALLGVTVLAVAAAPRLRPAVGLSRLAFRSRGLRSEES